MPPRERPFPVVHQEKTLRRPTLARAGVRGTLSDPGLEQDTSMRVLEAAISALALAAAILLGLAH